MTGAEARAGVDSQRVLSRWVVGGVPDRHGLPVGDVRVIQGRRPGEGLVAGDRLVTGGAHDGAVDLNRDLPAATRRRDATREVEGVLVRRLGRAVVLDGDARVISVCAGRARGSSGSSRAGCASDPGRAGGARCTPGSGRALRSGRAGRTRCTCGTCHGAVSTRRTRRTRRSGSTR